jgi:short-subunit dehydrogenase
LIQAVLAGMRGAGGGNIVIIASESGVIGGYRRRQCESEFGRHA